MPPSNVEEFREDVDARRNDEDFAKGGTRKDIERWDELIKGRARGARGTQATSTQVEAHTHTR